MKKELPFTVLISVYEKENENYLNDALLSIEHQTVKPNEIIIVEDGPLPEKLTKVISNYRENSVISVRSLKLKRNHGLGYALKYGVNNASYNLIARMDSDDICVPDRFENQLRAFSKDNQLVLIGGQVDEFSGITNNIVSKRWVPSSMQEIKSFMKYRNPFNHPTVMFKKNEILNSGNYHQIQGFEDYDLWARVVAKGYKCINSDKIMVHMRIDDGLYSRRGGLVYFFRYLKLRSRLKREDIINNKEMINGDFLMLVNILLPVKIRQYVYGKFLRK